MNLQSVKNVLKKHHSNQDYRPEDYYPNVVNAGDRYLGPYIPYVGEQYFDSEPKLLIYAMAQNLARGSYLISNWLDNDDHGILRHYYHSDSLNLYLHPYDTGHLKVIAALASFNYPGTDYQPSDNIHDRIAITNFVKFSFFNAKSGQKMDANPPISIYSDMWKYFCETEVSLLQPDMIIGVGNDVFNAIEVNIKPDEHIKLLKIPFPGRLNLNSRFIPRGNKLITEKKYNPIDDISRIQTIISGTPDGDGNIIKAIRTDWYYFKKMEKYFRDTLSM